MKRTAEQAWYKAANRREKLLFKRNILILHSIVKYPDSEIVASKPGEPLITKYLTADKKTGIYLPGSDSTYNKHHKVGDQITVRNLEHNDKKTLEKINADYVVIRIGENLFGIDYNPSAPENLTLIHLSNYKDPPYKWKGWLIVDPMDIENYPSGKPFVTTYGRYVVNYYLSALPFCKDIDPEKIPDELKFVNKLWKIGDFENSLSMLLTEKKIRPPQVDEYIDNGYFMGTYGEICGGTFTKKSLIPVPGLIKKRDELLEKHKMDLGDPRVMAIIENELIAMDKDNLKDDPSMDFLGYQKKVFTVERKRQYAAMGMVEKFGSQKGQYEFIPNSLMEGLQPEHYALMTNEARRGFYGRTVETQIAGVDTKLMIAVFQNVAITAEDCGTKKCLEIIIAPEVADSFLGQYAEKSPGHYELLTRDNIKDYIGHSVKLRSFMYCKQPDGFCMTCAGDKFKSLDYIHPGVMTIDIGSVFMALSMKAMHGAKVDIMELSSLDDYVLNP